MNKRLWLLPLAVGMGLSSLPVPAAQEGQRSTARYVGNRLDAERGGEIYRASCAECHDGGKENAPRLQDGEAWKGRSFKAFSVMNDHAKSGFLAMPARGGNPKLTKQDIADAVFYMTQVLQKK